MNTVINMVPDMLLPFEKNLPTQAITGPHQRQVSKTEVDEGH